MKALLQYYTVEPEPRSSIICYCDNVSALHRACQPPTLRGIRHRLIPEYDLINELHIALAAVALKIDPTHVKGHQDDDKEYEDMSPQAKLNVNCDKLAGDLLDSYTGFFEPRDSAPFIPSSKAALLIDDCVVTTELTKQVRMATNGEELRQYITKRNEWTDETFNSVAWDAIGTALKKENLPNRVRLLNLCTDGLAPDGTSNDGNKAPQANALSASGTLRHNVMYYDVDTPIAKPTFDYNSFKQNDPFLPIT